MRILLDTSVVVRLSELNTASAEQTREAIARLSLTPHEACLVPQVIYEYWSVATRPAERNGLGLSTAETARNVADFLSIFTLLRDERTVFEHWHEIVTRYAVLGKGVHDARLVAAMQRHSISHIMTLNESDFARYPDISAQSPLAFLEF